MQAISQKEFLQGFYHRLEGKRLPLRVVLELTHRCNFNCIHCYLGNERCPDSAGTGKELDTRTWKRILDELAEMETWSITLTGGEIFLREDILEIIVHARKKGFRVNLLTNGSLMSEHIIDVLLSYGIETIEISFLGIQKTFDDITGVTGSYGTVLDNLYLMRQKGMMPRLKICVFNRNRDEIIPILDFARNEGFRFFYSLDLVPPLNCPGAFDDLHISAREHSEIRNAIRNRRLTVPQLENKEQLTEGGDGELDCEDRQKGDEPSAVLHSNSLFRCMAGRTSLCINPYGRMNACMLLPFPRYDVVKGDVKTGWETVKRFVDTTVKPENYPCDACDLSDSCGPCPAWRYRQTGDMTGCPAYWRDIAHFTKNRRKQKGVMV